MILQDEGYIAREELRPLIEEIAEVRRKKEVSPNKEFESQEEQINRNEPSNLILIETEARILELFLFTHI